MIADIVFYAVVLLQLWLISHHYAKHVLVNMQFVTDNHSEEEYPKLYPKTKAHYLKGQRRFKYLNMGIFALGLAAILLLIYGNITEGYRPPNIAAAIIFIVQLIPFALMELSEYSYFNEMRKQVHKPVRTTSMTRRSLSTFTSMVLPLTALALLVIAIAADVIAYAQEQPFIFGVNEDAFYRSITIVVANVFLLILILCNVYGKKVDPFQADGDRFMQVKLTVQTLFYCSICMSLFFTIKSLLFALNAEGIEASTTAIYSIIIAYVSVGHRVRCVNLTKLNFDVYKA